MLLTRVADDEIWIRPALDIAHEAISLIDRMASCAPIARQGHPPAIDENPALLWFIPNDRCQHRQRDIVDLAHADPVHDEVEEHEYAGAHLA